MLLISVAFITPPFHSATYSSHFRRPLASIDDDEFPQKVDVDIIIFAREACHSRLFVMVIRAQNFSFWPSSFRYIYIIFDYYRYLITFQYFTALRRGYCCYHTIGLCRFWFSRQKAAKYYERVLMEHCFRWCADIFIASRHTPRSKFSKPPTCFSIISSSFDSFAQFRLTLLTVTGLLS